MFFKLRHAIVSFKSSARSVDTVCSTYIQHVFFAFVMNHEYDTASSWPKAPAMDSVNLQNNAKVVIVPKSS